MCTVCPKAGATASTSGEEIVFTRWSFFEYILIRNFSGEDPYLGARLTFEYVTGVQSQGVIAVVKHFVLNNQVSSHNVSMLLTM